ncbi:Crp/Fnr family transcriptional regulator [Streptomyces cyanogenus]|uniref:cAMP-activated global transcriptional regulator CRP n=1 Tax=Streptomyces cyanogenus TaxID=80860 RepID=A0ABX7TZ08_STRCY|nr:Crp/Fnr family transcriptional regulator [Streptomyces cyanogenus]QTE02023.1 cAMP-activated global transcriptional regulator CRP [Streptomyces cyanogenus]
MSEDIRVSPARTLRDLVPGEAWDQLTSGPRRTHPAGTTLLRQGDTGTHVLALISGLVKIVRRNIDGRERLLSFRGPGEVLGEMAVQNHRTRLADVQAISTCQVTSIPANAFRHFVERHNLPGRLACLANDRLWEQTEAGEGDLDQRLAGVLLRLAAMSDDSVFRLTRRELAQHLGVSRNSVSDALRRLGPSCVRADKTCIEVMDERRLHDVLRRLPA